MSTFVFSSMLRQTFFIPGIVVEISFKHLQTDQHNIKHYAFNEGCIVSNKRITLIT